METISQEWTQSHCAQLPLELWERIIADIDLPYLPRAWLNLRRVSRQVRAATEHVFASKHLPETRIEFKPLVLRGASIVRNPETVEISLAFDVLSEDGSRATFISEKGFDHLKDRPMSRYVAGATTTVYDALVRSWRNMTRPYRSPCPSVEGLVPPPHCLVMYRHVNDTELPGLEIGANPFQVSVLWKPMLSMFYGEIEYVKWADKVTRQHGARSNEGLMAEASRLGQILGQSSQAEQVSFFTNFIKKAQKESDDKTRKIRFQRFKRMLEKTDYREKGENLDEFLRMCCRPNLVESIQLSLAWDDDESEDNQEEAERGDGCFYDGMGMEFDGKRELNKLGEFSDDDDEWEDDEDLDLGDDNDEEMEEFLEDFPVD